MSDARSPDLSERDGGPVLVGAHPSFTRVVDSALRLAKSDLPLVITGEPGTGKKLLARAIHARSRQSGGAFIVLNSATMTHDSFTELELVAHRRSRGTIVFDRLSELPGPLQARLLSLINDPSPSVRLADGRRVALGVRIVGVSAQDLTAAAEVGNFRAELFYRLVGAELRLPPLRERRSDVPLLAEHFLAREVSLKRCPPRRLSAEVIDKMKEHDWPGNVHEMLSVVTAAALLASNSVIELADLPPTWRSPAPIRVTPALLELVDGFNLEHAVEDFEWRYIAEALRRTGGNKQAAARLLGTKRTTLVAKMRRWHPEK
jgi:DNA-binding NtrC family response regulator